MQIIRSALLDGARAAQGIVIVIDVFRACSLIAYALHWGAQRILPVAGIDAALQLKREHPHWLALGERYGRPLPHFDGGNSPSDLRQHELRGRTIIHTTHAGSQGLTAAAQADAVLTGAFVNFSATVRRALELQRARPAAALTVVAMGGGGVETSIEDELCATWFCAALQGGAVDAASLREQLVRTPAAEKFFDPAADWAPAADFDLCTAFDAVDVAAEMRSDDDGRRVLVAA